jgi:hypothetical protein
VPELFAFSKGTVVVVRAMLLVAMLSAATIGIVINPRDERVEMERRLVTRSKMTMVTEPTDGRWDLSYLSNISPLLEGSFRFDFSLND